MSKRGFTLMEILIVIVMIGILATLAVNYFTPIREKTLQKDAVVSLNLIIAAERAHKAESEDNLYVSCSTPAAGPGAQSCGDADTLMLPLNSSNWNYVVTANNPVAPALPWFTATATRNVGGATPCQYDFDSSVAGDEPSPVDGTNCI